MPYRCSPENLYTSYVQVRYSLHAHALCGRSTFIRQPDERASARKQIAHILPSFWLPIAAFSQLCAGASSGRLLLPTRPTTRAQRASDIP